MWQSSTMANTKYLISQLLTWDLYVHLWFHREFIIREYYYSNIIFQENLRVCYIIIVPTDTEDDFHIMRNNDFSIDYTDINAIHTQ